MKSYWIILYTTVVLASCGGGSGSSTAPPANTQPSNGQGYTVTKLVTADGKNVASYLLNNYQVDVYNFHPLGLNADPVVLYENNLYKIWFSSTANIKGMGQQGVAYASSSDGINWSDSKDINDWVKLDLKPGFDAVNNVYYSLETPYVLKVGTTYYLYYSQRLSNQAAFNIHLAKSPDGVNWTKESSAVFTPKNTWEQIYTDANNLQTGGVLEPSVIYDAGSGTFKMWYSTLGLGNNGVWGGRIGYATSTDGINWTRNPNPVFIPSVNGWDSLLVGHSNVIKDPLKGFHLFYVGGQNNNAQLQGIGHAYSDDGINWVRDTQPLIQRKANSWYSTFVGGPSALVRGNKVYIYFMGSDAPTDKMFSNVHFGRIEVDLSLLRP